MGYISYRWMIAFIIILPISVAVILQWIYSVDIEGENSNEIITKLFIYGYYTMSLISWVHAFQTIK